MVLEGADGFFGCIASVGSDRGALEVHVFFLEEFFQQRGDLVVKPLQFGAQAAFTEVLVHDCVSSCHFLC